MSNTIKIKRRTQGAPGPPDSLANGELAYNEVNDVLYYGASDGIRTLAGPGLYVTTLSSQSPDGGVGFEIINGNKTFLAPVTFEQGLAVNFNLPLESNDNTIAHTKWVRDVVGLELADSKIDAGTF